MKVIFLDIDGVLNYEQLYTLNNYCYKTTKLDRGNISHVAVERLARLVETTQAKIVITSSWRGLIQAYLQGSYFSKDVQTLLLLFAQYHISIYDYTISRVSGYYTDGTPFNRGYEVREWLSRHNDVTEFVILDDEDFKDWCDLKDHLVQTDFYNYGLTNLHIEKAIHILGGDYNETI